MCGIAGIMRFDGGSVSPLLLKSMCDAMAHRGPDDSGYLLIDSKSREDYPYRELTDTDLERVRSEVSAQEISNWGPSVGNGRTWDVGFGHRRLSIIDLSPAGHQPMSNRDQTIWITYNGEIYNYLSLRAGLKERGHTFSSRTDTEAIIHLYEELGERCVEKLDGIFAFALWDRRNGRLFLARDRFGAKPLYYKQCSDSFLFASEVKAILAVPGTERKLNKSALVEYFTFQNTFGEETLFDGIRLLAPGTSVIVGGSGAPSRRVFWDFSYHSTVDMGLEYYIESVRGALQKAVQKQLMSDVPLGAYLSGGMDSSCIAAFATAAIPRLMTFTDGFDVRNVSGFESAFDERADAEMMASSLGTEHYQMVIHSGDMQYALPKVVWHLEDLRMGMSYPNYYIARLAGKFVKVTLSGTGGDELFGGYPWRYRLVENARTMEDFETAYFTYWSRLVREEDHSQFFGEEILKDVRGFSPRDSFRQVLSGRRTERKSLDDPVKLALYFEAKTFLHGLLMLEDKLTMAHSLESRVPLLDNALIDLVSAIPTHHLIRHESRWNTNGDGNLAGKFIFREAMDGILPDDIIRKRKQGFSPPEQNWYKGPLMNYVSESLLDRRFLGTGIFQPRYIRKILDEHLSGRINHRLLIWSLLCFGWWHRIFLEREPPVAEEPSPFRQESILRR
ncbi:MAG: asparagine synthase (glutamine-hydrolyzing) [Armatimonadetes bacterium]|nr:asparagine synthase (glutamine-hydrolyzing) [Armatimonadota bacterium]